MADPVGPVAGPPPAAPGLFSELRAILRHSSVYGLGSVASKLVGFLMVPVYTRFLAPSDYGVIELLDLTLAIGGLVLYDLIIEALFRFYYRSEDEGYRRAVVSTALLAHAALSALGAGAALALAEPLARTILGSADLAPFLRVSLATFVVMQLNAIPLGYLRARQNSGLYIAASLTNLTLGLSLNILFIVVMQMGVWGVLLSNLISNSVLSAFLVPFTLGRTGLRFHRGLLRSMLRYGAPLIPAGVGNFSLNYSNRLFLNRFGTLTDVGLFGLGAKFSFMLSVLIIQPFLNIWDAKMFEIGERPNAREIYPRVATYSVFVSTWAALGLSLLIRDVLAWLVPPDFRPAAAVVPVLSLGYVFQILYYNFYTGILVANRTAVLAGIVVSTAGINLLLNAVLVPRAGMMGAAWAMALSYAFMAGTCLAAAGRIYPVRYEWRRLALMLSLAVALYAAAAAVASDQGIFPLLIRIALAGSFPFLLALIGFFDAEERRRIARALGPAAGRAFRLTGGGA